MNKSDLEIVLLPGLDGSGKLFRELAAALAGVAKVTVVSYPADARMQYADYVTFVRNIIQERRVVVLGESFSGPVAIKLAAECSNQILGVVLVSTFVESPWPRWLLRSVARIDLRYVSRRLKNIALMGFAQHRDLSGRVWSEVDALPEGVVQARLRDVAETDVRAQFDSLKCPVLVVYGASDWLLLHKMMSQGSAKAGNVHFEVISGPHMLLQMSTDQAARVIREFLSGLNR